MPTTVVADNPLNRQCDRDIDHTFWAHGRGGESYFLELYGEWCGPSHGHQARPILRFYYSVLRLGNFEASDFDWGVDARNPYHYGLWHPSIYDDQPFVGVLRGQEETLWLDDLVKGGVDAISGPEFTADSVFVERITFRSTQLQKSDIGF
jgi:hypothetical protein